MKNLEKLLLSVNENFKAEQFIYKTGFFLKFKIDFTTLEILAIEGDYLQSSGGQFTNMKQFPFYNEPVIKNIKNLIDWIKCNGKINLNSRIKISFVHTEPGYNEYGFKNILHNIYLYPCKNNTGYQEIFFHLCFIRGLDEPFQKKVIISTLNDPSNKYITRWVANSSDMKIILKNNEYDILNFTVQGFTAEEISQVLNLSVFTVNDCKKELYRIFEANNIYQLIRNAKEKNFI